MSLNKCPLCGAIGMKEAALASLPDAGEGEPECLKAMREGIYRDRGPGMSAHEWGKITDYIDTLRARLAEALRELDTLKESIKQGLRETVNTEAFRRIEAMAERAEQRAEAAEREVLRLRALVLERDKLNVQYAAERTLSERDAELAEARAALDRAAYALFQIKRMVPEAIPDFARQEHERACEVLDNQAAILAAGGEG